MKGLKGIASKDRSIMQCHLISIDSSIIQMRPPYGGGILYLSLAFVLSRQQTGDKLCLAIFIVDGIEIDIYIGECTCVLKETKDTIHIVFNTPGTHLNEVYYVTMQIYNKTHIKIKVIRMRILWWMSAQFCAILQTNFESTHGKICILRGVKIWRIITS